MKQKCLSLLLLMAGLCSPAAMALAANTLTAEDFLELRSGIGEVFPVVKVIPPGGRVQVLRQRGDWFLLEDKHHKRGWVSASRIAGVAANSPRAATKTSRKHQGLHVSAGAGWSEKDSLSRLAVGYAIGHRSLFLDRTQIKGDFLLQERQLLVAQWQPPVWRRLHAGARIGVGRLLERPRSQRVEISEKEMTVSMLGASLGMDMGRRALLSLDAEWNAPEERDEFFMLAISLHGFYSL